MPNYSAMMGDRDLPTNEYLSSDRAQEDDNDLFAAIGKQVLSLSLNNEEVIDDDERVKVVDEVEGICMNCFEDSGITRLLLTKIPYFREVILTSFYCDNCHFANNGIQQASEVQERGSKYTFEIKSLEDLQRQVVKSENATFRIESLDIMMPPGNGRLTNVEGIVNSVLSDLEFGQKQRLKVDPLNYAKIEILVQTLLNMLTKPVKHPCIISLDDPTGNSWIEPSTTDFLTLGKYTHVEYRRTITQNEVLGLADNDAEEHEEETKHMDKIDEDVQETKHVDKVDGDVQETKYVDKADGDVQETKRVEKPDGDVQETNVKEEINDFEYENLLDGKSADTYDSCPGCAKLARFLFQKVNIPHFKEVLISTTVCDLCGYHSTDVSTGGSIASKGKRIILAVKSPRDLHREILMSHSCHLSLPELEFGVEPGSLGGRFTTLEGVLTKMRDDLKQTTYTVGDETVSSDATPDKDKLHWEKFFAVIDKYIEVEVPYTVVMEDPLADTYCQTFDTPGQGAGSDPQVHVVEYYRTEKEEENLGLTDMKTKLNENGEYVRDTFPENADKLENVPEDIEEPLIDLGEETK